MEAAEWRRRRNKTSDFLLGKQLQSSARRRKTSKSGWKCAENKTTTTTLFWLRKAFKYARTYFISLQDDGELSERTGNLLPALGPRPLCTKGERQKKEAWRATHYSRTNSKLNCAHPMVGRKSLINAPSDSFGNGLKVRETLLKSTFCFRVAVDVKHTSSQRWEIPAFRLIEIT